MSPKEQAESFAEDVLHTYQFPDRNIKEATLKASFSDGRTLVQVLEDEARLREALKEVMRWESSGFAPDSKQKARVMAREALSAFREVVGEGEKRDGK